MDDDLRRLARAALAEDLGVRGDVTSLATVPAEARGTGVLATRQEGVVAGLDAAAAVFDAVQPAVALHARVADGARVGVGAVVAEVEGTTRGILAAERTALNLLGHLSGVATLTARFVAAISGSQAVIRDTRKTLPGLRALEKRAVVAGGGTNHRFGLDDGVLVKDNHVAAAGGVAAATRAALAGAGGLDVQVEVDDLDQLAVALDAGARSVLLDNFVLPDLREAVRRCRAHPEPVFVEASGGVRLDTVADIARTGVDAVAVGVLTHSAPALDVGLDLVL